jgi:ABC-2 type transport system permease protein
LLGKLIGSGVAAMFSLIGIVAMIIIMQIPMNAGDLLRVIALTPILALAGGALGVFLIGLTQEPRTVAVAVPLLIFPQMFLSGALIPVSASSGILGALSKIIPMTYSIDLARNIYYWGKPEYAAAVLHPPMLDLAITVGFFLVFTIVGTILFVRADRNR